jgi:hypothetical protein
MNKSKIPVEPIRVVLEGVPKINFYAGGKRCPEDFPFPSSLRACLEYMGESYGCDHLTTPQPTWQLCCTYAYIMSACGYAFWLAWKPGWHMDNNSILSMSADMAEPFRHAFEAIGHEHEFILKDEKRVSEAYFRRRITESIRDKGRPVLAFGVIGPPECCIITGYDEHGDVLLGWNFFQDFPEFNVGSQGLTQQTSPEPLGYFRKRDWFKDTHSLIIIGEKQQQPPRNVLHREILKWALEVILTPMVNGRHSGVAAYTAWAEHLLRDEDFPAEDKTVLQNRHMVHDDAVGMIAEARWYASLFLPQIARQEASMAEELLAAASCYAAEHDLMWKIWGLVGGIGHEETKTLKLAESSVRRQIVPVILQAQEKDKEAADHIECALKK